MYAAMPAILKTAVERCYENMGWDLLQSTNKYDIIFPDFHDLLDVMPQIINASDYSSEMKGNYSGALITRVESLTNGYYRTIFQKEEISEDLLFKSPSIVDLSRVGSSETKSLLMGILFMKLQEYRISSEDESNLELRHITVLEEAHNLMRRTTFDQSNEGANLQGKAVEMISNAIAEMRSLGEGFIIADQAPGLLDQSVIRNTNTKVILRLPDWDDRKLVGKAANLNEDQINELARLKTGCAAVYQNDWQEAVLCQCNHFGTENAKKYSHESNGVDIIDTRKKFRSELIKLLLGISLDSEEAVSIKVTLPKRLIPYYPKLINKQFETKKEIYHTLVSILKLSQLLDRVGMSLDIDVWFDSLCREIASSIDTRNFSKDEQLELVRVIFIVLSSEKPKNKEVFDSKLLKLESREEDLF